MICVGCCVGELGLLWEGVVVDESIPVLVLYILVFLVVDY